MLIFQCVPVEIMLCQLCTSKIFYQYFIITHTVNVHHELTTVLRLCSQAHIQLSPSAPICFYKEAAIVFSVAYPLSTTVYSTQYVLFIFTPFLPVSSTFSWCFSFQNFYLLFSLYPAFCFSLFPYLSGTVQMGAWVLCKWVKIQEPHFLWFCNMPFLLPVIPFSWWFPDLMRSLINDYRAGSPNHERSTINTITSVVSPQRSQPEIGFRSFLM